jgi:phosphatidylglycerol---prolipoprotein diacylglyceryl transferase
MLKFNVDPILVHLGPLAISWYGLAVATGILVGIWLMTREAARKGLTVEPVLDLILWIAIGGVIGARLLYVLDRWAYFIANPLQILALHTGGLSIMGAIVGGGLTAAVLGRRRTLPQNLGARMSAQCPAWRSDKCAGGDGDVPTALQL